MTVNERFAVVGLGYVGLPVAVAFGRRFPGTIGFDINTERVARLKDGFDATGEVTGEELAATDVHYTSDPSALGDASFIIVAVPTPIDSTRRPDLSPLEAASRTVGRHLKKGSVVVFESTVFPGATEEVCAPILEQESGLVAGVDFWLGYSPERINPGDKEHSFTKITKVVSGQDAATLERVAAAYEAVVEAGVHRASSIMVAEAAKVIENTQRDLNIALMNEIALIFDRLGIRTKDVLEAAGTKWNFLRFTPGLVGGHCIGVDPYYLTAKAEAVGYHPQVILAGRRINDDMGAYVARRLIKLFIDAGHGVKGAKVGILGLTFKEDVPDLRNSRVPDIIHELKEFGIEPMVFDPHAEPEEARNELGVELSSLEQMKELDGLVLAVGHREFKDLGTIGLAKMLKDEGVFIDVKSLFSADELGERVRYWSL